MDSPSPREWCAWCIRDGLQPEAPYGASHGICEAHLDQLYPPTPEEVGQPKGVNDEG